MRSLFDFFHAPVKAATILYIVLGCGMFFFVVVLMNIFPAYLYIAMPKVPLPHIDLAKMTVAQWVGVLCGFSLLVFILARKGTRYD